MVPAGLSEGQEYKNPIDVILTIISTALVCAKLALLVMMRHERFSVSPCPALQRYDPIQAQTDYRISVHCRSTSPPWYHDWYGPERFIRR
jgi:hypothetical protein